ncbi:aspartyl protease family protein [Sphingosinithalassobacter portus]|uniref:aspartyl protease family protein n=1 Tax=Stakelama portus TaxID=2676234 RepID=UPI000D6E442C|nr:aspartyl protease family protein [Sphingosinithalassobacter portus]
MAATRLDYGAAPLNHRRRPVAMRLLPGLLLCLLTCVPLAAAEQQIRLSDDSEARWIPFELTEHNQIVFTMTFAGEAATALLDTGLSDTLVSDRLAAATGLRSSVGEQAAAIGGDVSLRWAASPALGFGGLSRSGGRIGIASLDGAGSGIDLLIGSDILSCCALDIDYDARRFRILPSGRLPFRGKSASLHLTPSSRSYVTRGSLAGATLSPMIVDTGDGAAITIARTIWDASDYAAAPTTSTIAFGLGGAIETDVAVISEIEIADVKARQVEVRIEDARGFSTRIGAAGRIGSGFLLGYRVLLDPRAGRIVLSPGGKAGAAPLRSTSGLLLAFQGDELRVLHVMRHSPAARAGWRVGDRICAADGISVRDGVSATGLVGWTVGAPGRTVHIAMCDGSERSLTLANFY